MWSLPLFATIHFSSAGERFIAATDYKLYSSLSTIVTTAAEIFVILQNPIEVTYFLLFFFFFFPSGFHCIAFIAMSLLCKSIKLKQNFSYGSSLIASVSKYLVQSLSNLSQFSIFYCTSLDSSIYMKCLHLDFSALVPHLQFYIFVCIYFYCFFYVLCSFTFENGCNMHFCFATNKV